MSSLYTYIGICSNRVYLRAEQVSSDNLLMYLMQGSQGNPRPNDAEPEQAWQSPEHSDIVTTAQTDEDKTHDENADSYQAESQDVNEDPTSKADPTQLENSGNNDVVNDNNRTNQVAENVEENVMID